MNLVIASYSIPYRDKYYCLLDLDRLQIALKHDGKPRVFSSRESARGTRSRIARGLQDTYTISEWL